jgi:hypothetical protein
MTATENARPKPKGLLPFKGNGAKPDADAARKRKTFQLFTATLATVTALLALLYLCERNNLEDEVSKRTQQFQAFHQRWNSALANGVLSTPAAKHLAEESCTDKTTDHPGISADRKLQYQLFCSSYIQHLSGGDLRGVELYKSRLADLVRADIRNTLPLHNNLPYVIAWLIFAALYVIAEWSLYVLSSLEFRDLEPAFNILDVSFIGSLVQYSGGLWHPLTTVNLVLVVYLISVTVVALEYLDSRRMSRVGLYAFAVIVSLFWGTFQGSATLRFFTFFALAMTAFSAVFTIVYMSGDRLRSSAGTLTPAS